MGYILYGILGILLVVLCILVEDKEQLLKIGMIGLFSGINIIILGYISGIIIRGQVYFMDTNSIIRVISNKFYTIGFISIVIGIMVYLMYFAMTIIYKNRHEKRVNK